MEREQREQARQERHAARALATAAALSIQDEGTSGADSCHDEQAPPPPNDSSPDSPPQEQQQLQQQHDNYFSRSSVTEESCSPVGYGGDSRLHHVDYTPSPVINSAELADLLLEVRLVCVSVCWPLLYFYFPPPQKKTKFF